MRRKPKTPLIGFYTAKLFLPQQRTQDAKAVAAHQRHLAEMQHDTMCKASLNGEREIIVFVLHSKRNYDKQKCLEDISKFKEKA